MTLPKEIPLVVHGKSKLPMMHPPIISMEITMNPGERRKSRVAASYSNAQMIYNVLQTEPTPRDAAATLAAVHAALIWTIEPNDEANARKIAGEMIESIVALWKVNRAAVAPQSAETQQ